jgi:4a-hydroxytetrahydrobiopterin dehydratase
MTDLLQRKCQPLEGGAPMNEAEIRSHLAQLSGWRLSPPGRHRPEADGLRQATDSPQGLSVSGRSPKGENLSAQHEGDLMNAGAIEKTFAFKNYYETIAFVNALAWICHTQDHHPELAVSYNRCVVRFNTHSVGGISINDFICAAKTDALVAFVG